YWLTFRCSYVLRDVRNAYDENVSTVAAILNPFLLLLLAKYQSSHPELAFPFLLALGTLEFVIGQLPSVRRRRAAFVILTIIGATLVTLAFPFRESFRQHPSQLSFIWLALTEAFFLAGVFLKETLFRWLGMLASLLVVGYTLFTQHYDAPP